MEDRYKRGAIRVGSTAHLEERRSQYERENYKGTMYYADTKNMKKAEDRLFKDACGECLIHNQQCRSNSKPEEGKVYLIVGRKETK